MEEAPAVEFESVWQLAVHEKQETQTMNETAQVASIVSSRLTDNKSHELLEFSSLPDHMRDNEYIHKYYRGEWPFHQVLLSLFRIHNETGNIWT